MLILFILSPAGGAEGSEANALDLSIEDLMQVTVIGASRFEQTLSEAPSFVTIITADDIKKYGYRSLADLLRSVSGFIVTNDRNYQYVTVRGFSVPGDYNSRVLLLVDGHRINDPLYGQILIGNDMIVDIDMVDRVEIVRGPSSSLYGNNAFFGVINIITRKGGNLAGAEVSGSAGRFETYKGRVTYGNRFKSGFEMLLSGSYFSTEGQKRIFYPEFDDPSTNNGVFENGDRERSYNLLATLSYQGFTLQGAFVERKKLVPTAAFETDFNDNRTHTVDKQGYLDLKYEHEFPGGLGLIARVFLDKTWYRGDYISSGVTNKDFGDAEWWGAELQVRKTFFDRHRLIAGAEYQDNFGLDQKTYDVDPYYLYIDESRRWKRWALYVQDEFRILDNLLLNAGLRYDHFDVVGGTTNPRVALIYSPFEKTTLKLLYGTAFRAPNDYERYYTIPEYGQRGNPDLSPEKISTYELVWEQFIGSHLKLTTAGFYYRIKDHIRQVTNPEDGIDVYVNVGDVEAKGLEVELEALWDNGLRGRASYTYQDAKDVDTGEWLVNSPRHLVKLNIIVPLWQDKVFAGIEGQYTSARRTHADNRAGDLFVANVTLFSQKVLKGLELSASVYNLFNEKFSDPGGPEHVMDTIPQDGRGFRVKATYAF